MAKVIKAIKTKQDIYVVVSKFEDEDVYMVDADYPNKSISHKTFHQWKEDAIARAQFVAGWIERNVKED